MIRNFIFAAATTFAVAAATLVAPHDASARGSGGGHGDGFSRGGHGGGMRVAAVGRRGGMSRPGGMHRPVGMHRPGSLGRRPGHVHRPGGLGHRPHHVWHRPHWPHRPHVWGHRYPRTYWTGYRSYRPYRTGYRAYTPAVSYPAASRALPVRTSAAVCDSCGGWTQDGCYMTYRKVVDASGQPQLKCVKACDDQPEAPVEGS
jgi:hypothetical protein